VLRPWSESDAPALRRALAANDAHLRAWTPWVVDGRTPGQSIEQRLRAHAEAFANGTEWVYGIFDEKGGEILGGCGLYPRVGPRAIEVGYWVSKSHTRQGLATGAAWALTLAAFSAPEIDRVEMHVDAENVASAGVPRRLGYRVVAPVVGLDAQDEDEPGVIRWVLTRDEFNQATSK
jgi:RimJ/RimL family protein N-acetyltransferase